MEKLVPGIFLKNQNWAYSWINNLKFCTVCFIACQGQRYRNIFKQSCRLLAFTSYKDLFLIKQKEFWIYFPCLNFFMIFEEKYFSCYVLLIDQVSSSGCLYFVRYWVVCIAISSFKDIINSTNKVKLW